MFGKFKFRRLLRHSLEGVFLFVLLMLIALFFCFRFSMTEEQLLQIQAVIARRRRDD